MKIKTAHLIVKDGGDWKLVSATEKNVPGEYIPGQTRRPASGSAIIVGGGCRAADRSPP